MSTKSTIEDRVIELAAKRVPELQALFAEAVGETTRSPNKTFLARRIAQAEADAAAAPGAQDAPCAAPAVEGGTDPAGDAPADVGGAAAPEEAPDAAPATAPARDPRLPAVGTTFERVYKGETHRVTILDDGVECAGQHYRSLSGLARKITGQVQNGFRFFNLGEKDTETARARRATGAAAKRDDAGERLLSRIQRFLEVGAAPATFVARLGELAAAAATSAP